MDSIVGLTDFDRCGSPRRVYKYGLVDELFASIFPIRAACETIFVPQFLRSVQTTQSALQAMILNHFRNYGFEVAFGDRISGKF